MYFCLCSINIFSGDCRHRSIRIDIWYLVKYRSCTIFSKINCIRFCSTNVRSICPDKWQPSFQDWWNRLNLANIWEKERNWGKINFLRRGKNFHRKKSLEEKLGKVLADFSEVPVKSRLGDPIFNFLVCYLKFQYYIG